MMYPDPRLFLFGRLRPLDYASVPERLPSTCIDSIPTYFGTNPGAKLRLSYGPFVRLPFLQATGCAHLQGRRLQVWPCPKKGTDEYTAVRAAFDTMKADK